MLIISGKNETLNGPFPLIHSFAFYYIFNKEQKIVLPLGSCIAHLCGSVKKFRHLVSFCFRMCVVRNRFKCVNYHHHGYEQNPSVFSKGKNLPYFVYLSWHFCLFCLSENFVIVVACVCVCVFDSFNEIDSRCVCLWMFVCLFVWTIFHWKIYLISHNLKAHPKVTYSVVVMVVLMMITNGWCSGSYVTNIDHLSLVHFFIFDSARNCPRFSKM